ncbi:MAG: polysaccharide pyruvyl transferase family protein [Eubacterium sp.]|nr:polysaccharide pyruvyl transferase family protein [Eubacterium sp.]
MQITLFNCAWTNRGDEAAFRSMVESLRELYPDIHFNLLTHGTKELEQFPYSDDKVKIYYIRSITRRNHIDVPFLFLSRGRLAVSKNIRELIKIIKNSDMVFHNPGGPSMGDLYPSMQFPSYYKFIITRLFRKPYLFYAPSMGPFENKKENILRRYIFNGAELVTTREELSAQYYKKLGAKKEITVTADSALQYRFDAEPYEKQFNEYKELNSFLKKYDRIIGITVATLRWHRIHKTDEIENRISDSFNAFIDYLKDKGIGVVFIPQIFGNGEGNDYPLMQKFAKENCFVCDDEHDCFFQQHLISKLHAVVGLRYHSNIFSAKMNTPFLSVAYEQKMNGFAKLAGMEDYLIDITELTFEKLREKFELLEENHEDVKKHLEEISPMLYEKAYLTTKLTKEVIDRYYENGKRDN